MYADIYIFIYGLVDKPMCRLVRHAEGVRVVIMNDSDHDHMHSNKSEGLTKTSTPPLRQ